LNTESTEKTPTPAAILLKAANVIKMRGWWQNGFIPDDAERYRIDLDTCPVCVLAAINVAADHAPDDIYDPDDEDERTDAAIALAKHLDLTDAIRDGDALVYAIGDQWNDKVAESAEQVITALRECAAELAGTAK
jgi:hypothetical protein